jgi:predicted phage terminase large subunit-like protein
MAFDIDNPRECKVWRARLENSLMDFTRFFLKHRLGYRMIVSPHHWAIVRALEAVYDGKIKRLIMNLPPGYTKTEFVIAFIAWGMAKNSKSKYIHTTYSDALALENSAQVREIVNNPYYQAMWPCELRKDTKAKGAWKNVSGGGMQARPAGGSITGFRAGQPEPGFSGAFVMDDMIKPDDAYSKVTVETINKRFNGVFRSRLMQERVTPMILIMQRIAQNDPTGFLLRGGTNEKWHHLNLPALYDKTAPYPKEYTHGIQIDPQLDSGPIWPYKHDKKELKALDLADPYVYKAQYQQTPAPPGGGIFKNDWWSYYTWKSVIPEFRIITADTAQKTSEQNDFSCFQLWGYLKGNIYLLDLIKGRWEAPELNRQFQQFWIKHYATGEAMTTNKLRYAAVEDKSSGTGLIQFMRKLPNMTIPVKAVQRNRDKVSRAMDTVPYIASGHVFVPSDAPFTLDFMNEMGKFSSDDTHDFDDQVDPMMDACDLLLAKNSKTAKTW